MADRWLIVGLGNPGDRYRHTRHNAGHMVVAELAERLGQPLKKHPSNCFVAEGRRGILPGGTPGAAVSVAILPCYMNESGGPTSSLVRYLKIDPTDRLLVVHDELDLPQFELRLKRGGGEGGHNGLRSISRSLGTKDYARLRVGIGRPHPRQNPADYVLEPFARRDQDDLALTIKRAGDAVENVVNLGFLAAQQKLHSPA